MPLPVYMDVHVPMGVTQGLRRRRIDVRTAQDDAADRMADEQLLERATLLGRILLSQDVDYLEIAARWQRHGIAFRGMLFVPQGTPIGRIVEDVEICLAGLTAEEFMSRLVHLPLR